MVDTISGGVSTGSTLAIGGAASSLIDMPGDEDWFRVNLVAGQTYVFALNGAGAPALWGAFVLALHSAAP